MDIDDYVPVTTILVNRWMTDSMRINVIGVEQGISLLHKLDPSLQLAPVPSGQGVAMTPLQSPFSTIRGFMVMSVPCSSPVMTGIPAMEVYEMRERFVNVRMTDDELSLIDSYRKDTPLSRSAYMRETALATPPKIIPSINREQWASLARMGANLSQLAHHANLGRFSEPVGNVLQESLEVLKDVRRQLLGGLS